MNCKSPTQLVYCTMCRDASPPHKEKIKAENLFLLLWRPINMMVMVMLVRYHHDHDGDSEKEILKSCLVS